MKRRARAARRRNDVPLVFEGDAAGARMRHGAHTLLEARRLAADRAEVRCGADRHIVSPIGDSASFRLVLSLAAEGLLASVRHRALILADEAGMPSGIDFGELWDHHNQLWLAEHAV